MYYNGNITVSIFIEFDNVKLNVELLLNVRSGGGDHLKTCPPLVCERYNYLFINFFFHYWFVTGKIVSIPTFPTKTVHNHSFTHVMSKALEAHYIVLKKRYAVVQYVMVHYTCTYMQTYY